MKSYPSIRYYTDSDLGKQIIAFNKFDGSNIRAEWNKKRGFYKFGSKNRLISESDPLGEAISIINNDSEDLLKELNSLKTDSAICFFEFWGNNSKFGSHIKEEHYCTLIDISIYKKGYQIPVEFINTFSKRAPVLYNGPLTDSFVQSVKDGTLAGLGTEGVVCKGDYDKKTGIPLMFKLKRQSWFDELKKFCNGDSKKIQELA